MIKLREKITFNSPVILSFTLICFVVLVLNKITGDFLNTYLFCVYRFGFTDVLGYLRLFLYIFGHAGWSHFSGNITMLLIVGPLLEERYGSKKLLLMMAITAVITGLIHISFFPDTALIGASGIVYMMILLSSITNVEDGKIPMTLLIIAVVYIGGQIYEGLFIRDNISNLGHIVGGVLGAIMGYLLNRDSHVKL
ncbi:MAG: rhomboid family intramembrane serine protease [Clostridiales bacterium]|nr:rhomboid family intramembrane serine protease [Clostridiales bacterium]